MTTNKYKVSKKQWKTWSKTSRRIFNSVYKWSLDIGSDLMKHPKSFKPKPAEWKTLCWNFAWIAADAHDNTLPDGVV